ncbi:AAA family ATPase [Saccharopolyspora taberi]|uniref:AAA family ATPase n=1 Tax=Saccharopolyspora taberi TaxID=60895 RepID=A0ABN3VDU5_9PSEU
MPENERFAVLTGGPGSGKSTLIDQLESMGFARSEEAGRGIIRDQAAIGGAALPWHDRQLFAELMLSWELRSYRLAEAATSTVLFDRGVPDVIGYLRVEGLPVPEHVHRAAREFRYRTQVFVAPPWPEIYVRDEERKQSPEVAERTYEAMVDAYTECGYELVELPRVSVRERAEFVVDLLS